MAEVLFLSVVALGFGITVCVLALNPGRVLNQSTALATFFGSVSFLFAYLASRSGSSFVVGVSSPLLMWLKLSGAFSILAAWSLWLMGTIVTTEPKQLKSAIAISWPQLIIALILVGIALSNYYIPSHSTPQNPLRGPGYFVVQSSMAAFLVATLVKTYRAQGRLKGIKQLETQFFVLNACIACLVMVLFNVASTQLELPHLRKVSSVAIFAMFGLMAWCLNYHRIFDARHIFLSLGQRLGMLLLLVSTSIAFSAVLESVWQHPASHTFAVCISGTFFFVANDWTRRWLKIDAERTLLVPRAQVIQLSKEEADPHLLRGKFEALLRDFCTTEVSDIIVVREQHSPSRRVAAARKVIDGYGAQGWVTTEHLQRLRQSDQIREVLSIMIQENLAAIVSVPRGSSTPSLQIALGRKLSQRPYTFPELDVLLHLAESMDSALSHAQLAVDAAKIERMESVTMISRSLAHDLNNLTTPVSSYLAHRENKIEPHSVEAQAYAAARHSIEIMQEYIRESLFFAKRLSPDFKTTTTSELFLSVAQTGQLRAKRRNVRLVIEPPPLIEFVADPALVQRLIGNLINNAIDASPPGETIRLTAASRDDKKVTFTVTDSGQGIPVENMRRIFEPYFTTKDTGDERRGIGLGLAICQKIADLHGGQIEVINLSPQGTAFTAIFPKNQASHPTQIP